MAAADDELEAFFAEVEQLSIGGGTVDEQCDRKEEKEAAGSEHIIVREEEASCNTNSKQKKATAEKKGLIANAKDGQRAWSEFQKVDISSSGGAGTGDKANKISFQIKSTKGKAKKKKGKTKKQPEQEAEEGRPSTENGSFDSNATTRYQSNEPESACPRWTLVVDTCALLEDNGREVQVLLDVANRAARAKNREHGASVAAIVDEPIDVVIPFKVWGELEYQSKSEDAQNSYAARAAIRMLRGEMESGAIHVSGEMINVLRSQSLSESKEAATKYLSVDHATTNDDHILACALAENEGFEGTALSAGGVVMATIDNNLACKAYANGLKVHSPSEFREYYERRMESLRQRAAGTLNNSTARR